MKYGIQEIDHAVVTVTDPMRAGDLLARAGFTVTPISEMKGMGLANRLVLFQPQSSGTANFIELMGVMDTAKAPPPLLRFLDGTPGYRFIVLSGPDADATWEQLSRAGYEFGKPMAVTRDWQLPSGKVLHLAFNVMMPIEAPLPFNFCAYETPEHYVRKEFLSHPNGALTMTGLLCQSETPQQFADYFADFMERRAAPLASHSYALSPNHVELLVANAAAWNAALDGVPVRASKERSRIIGCRIEVANLAETERYLRNVGLRPVAGPLGLVLSSPLEDGTVFLFHD